VLYTARDVNLFHWIVEVISGLMKDKVHGNVHVVIALTSGGDAIDASTAEVIAQKQRDFDDTSSSSSSDSKLKGSLRIQSGRINFMTDVPKENIVYFQGSAGLQDAVQKGCKMKKCKFIAGPAYDQDQNKKRNILEALRMNCVKRGDGIV